MSTAAVLDLGRLFDDRADPDAERGGPSALRIEGHLPECRHRDRPAVGCDWCLSAVADAGIRRLCELVRDARALVEDHVRRGGDVSVAWLVAAGDVVDAVAGVGVRTRLVPTVPSVAELRSQVRRRALVETAPLAELIDVASASGGPIERRCLLSSALLAAGALQRPEHAERLASMPPRVRTTLRESSRLLSVDVQLAGILAAVERIHWDGLPVLHSRSAWRRRTRPGSATTLSRQQVADAGFEAGSLEALVVEAALDETTEHLTELADELTAAAPPVLYRDDRRAPWSTATRALTMRMGRIDWTVTFLDSQRCSCWEQRPEGTLVPWTVPIAVSEADRQGLVGATHGAAPDGAVPPT